MSFVFDYSKKKNPQQHQQQQQQQQHNKLSQLNNLIHS